MSLQVSFSFPTDAEKQEFEALAKSKGLTLSQFVKTARGFGNMTKYISFGVSEKEKEEITRYVRSKKRWKDVGSLARDALYQLMSRYPLAEKRKPASTADGQPTKESIPCPEPSCER